MSANDSRVEGFLDCDVSRNIVSADFRWSQSDDSEATYLKYPFENKPAMGTLVVHSDDERLGLPHMVSGLDIVNLNGAYRQSMPQWVGHVAFQAFAHSLRTGEAIRDHPILLSAQEARIMRGQGLSLRSRIGAPSLR